MSKTVYLCETIGCGVQLADPNTEFCGKCQTRIDNMRICILCDTQFHPNSDEEMCCAGWVMRNFFRGAHLTDRELAWVFEGQGSESYATPAQRELAVSLAEHFARGEESVSGSLESPWVTHWWTGSVELAVEFSSPFRGSKEPVETVSVKGADLDLTNKLLDVLTAGHESR